MHKEIVISMIIAIIIFGLNYVTENYIKNTVAQMKDYLNTTKEELIKDEPDYEMALKKANDAYDKWEELDDTIALYIEHNEIEKVKTAIISMKSFIEMEDDSQAVDSIDRCHYILDNIKKREEFSIDNIF